MVGVCVFCWCCCCFQVGKSVEFLLIPPSVENTVRYGSPADGPGGRWVKSPPAACNHGKFSCNQQSSSNIGHRTKLAIAYHYCSTLLLQQKNTMLPIDYMVPCLRRPIESSVISGGVFTAIDMIGGRPFSFHTWGEND